MAAPELELPTTNPAWVAARVTDTLFSVLAITSETAGALAAISVAGFLAPRVFQGLFGLDLLS